MNYPAIVNLLRFMASPEGLALVENVEKLIADLYPPASGLVVATQLAAPTLQKLANLASGNLIAGFLSGELIAKPDGSIINKAWAANPRHWLNPDGTFMTPQQYEALKKAHGIE